MVFHNFIMRIRRTLLCCNVNKHLEIGEPTNVRKVDISESLPGLTDAQRKYIREKASSDAIHLLGLQSHPHTSPTSPTESLTPNHSPPPSTRQSSREPSEALLNAASKDLPNALPTPPRRMHHESSPPAARMKSMKLAYSSPTSHPIAKKLSFSSASSSTTDNSALFKNIEATSSPRGLHESFMTLDLEFDWEGREKERVETPRTLSLSEGFEVQEVVGGSNKVMRRAVSGTRSGASSASESNSDSDTEDGCVDGERSPLVKI